MPLQVYFDVCIGCGLIEFVNVKFAFWRSNEVVQLGCRARSDEDSEDAGACGLHEELDQVRITFALIKGVHNPVKRMIGPILEYALDEELSPQLDSVSAH